MSYRTVALQKGKEQNAMHRHPWVFSGAFAKRPDEIAHGELVQVVAYNGVVLGTGTYSAKSSIAVRIFAFGEAEVKIDAAWFAAAFRNSEAHRAALGLGADTDTSGYRVIFGEADGVPGLVVDRYADILVVQSSTAGIDALMPEIVTALCEVFSPRSIIERSDISVRKEEGLAERVGALFGEEVDEVAFTEHGMKFLARPKDGQKTGFYLDQRELRASIARHAQGKDVLNVFSYTGAASIAAITGGAKSVLNVDASKEALAGCLVHAEANGVAKDAFTIEEGDAFQWLGAPRTTRYGMVVIDPPALIKSQRDVEEGKKAYHFLNRAALKLVEDGGIFVTSSCSRFMPEEDLAFTLRRASVQAGVVLEVLEIVRQSADHPQSVYFPESSYLKSFVCRVRKA